MLRKEPAVIIAVIGAIVQAVLMLVTDDTNTDTSWVTPVVTLIVGIIVRSQVFSKHTITQAGLTPENVEARARLNAED